MWATGERCGFYMFTFHIVFLGHDVLSLGNQLVMLYSLHTDDIRIIDDHSFFDPLAVLVSCLDLIQKCLCNCVFAKPLYYVQRVVPDRYLSTVRKQSALRK
jgi:hypothetical protein